MQPTAVINCSTGNIIKEGDDFNCLCNSTGGNLVSASGYSKQKFRKLKNSKKFIDKSRDNGTFGMEMAMGMGMRMGKGMESAEILAQSK